MGRVYLVVLAIALVACELPSLPGQTPSPGQTSQDPRPFWQDWLNSWRYGERYRQLLQAEPDRAILVPVKGVNTQQIADTFGAPRPGGRQHEGQDIFAPKGTPIYSATEGLVWRIGVGELGGLYVYVLGPGGRRYYYAHLDAHAEGLEQGQEVSPQTLLGYVGNTGNARTTPPHLHFGVYGNWLSGDERVIDPLTLLRDRDWKNFEALKD
jgi:murein DD-endopeptidase MepM/ murein hydrolase activator NlpD